MHLPAGLSTRIPLPLLLGLLGLVPRTAHGAWPHDPFANVPLAAAAGTQQFPDAVSDGAGGAIVFWADTRGGASDIYAQCITSQGTIAPGWPTAGLAICTAAGIQESPKAVSDGAGGAIVVWTDARGGSDRDIYAMRVTSTGTFPGGWPANGRQIYADSHDEVTPMIATDGAGGAVIAWDLIWIIGTDHDIYGARVNASGTVLWANPLYAPGARQEAPVIAADGAGGLIVAYEDNQPGTYDIKAHRYNASGAFVWGPITVCGNGAQQLNLWGTSDGAGGIIMTWDDYRVDANSDVYAERLNGAGARPVGWIADGNPVCVATGAGSVSSLIPDGSGGAYIAWWDYRSGSWAVYMQRMLGGATPGFGWTVDGVLVGFSLTPQSLQIAGDGSGGAIVSWAVNAVGDNGNLYASRLTTTGARPPGWVAYGSPVSMATGHQVQAVVVSDASGGAVIVWADSRSGLDQAYAQNIDHFGQLGDARPTIATVADVKADQGGSVRMVWNSSYLDADPVYGIGSYWIWRQTPATVAEAAVAAGATWVDESGQPEMRAASTGKVFRRAEIVTATYAWEFLASQPANGAAQYSYVASTTSDSIAGHNPYTLFMVEARSTDPGAFWDSPPDSGYSVDNLPPAAPAPFVAFYASGSTSLHWARNFEADFALYRVYRASYPSFTPGPSTFVAELPDTGYVDSPGSPYYYKVCAFDVHGNTSCSGALPSGTTGVEDPGVPLEPVLAIAGENPSRGDARLHYGLPRTARVTLAIFDAGGRRVRELASGTVEAGMHTVAWDGRNARGGPVAAGFYVARFEVEGRALRVPIVIVR